MRELTFEHITDDFHVAMTVRTEALARRDAVFVEHAQRAELDMVLVEIFCKREAVVRVQPAVVGMATILAASGDFHGDRLYRY